MQKRPLVWLLVGIAVLVVAGVIAWTFGRDTSPVIKTSTKIRLESTTSTAPSRVGEPPDTASVPGQLPNAGENPAAAGIDPCKIFSQADIAQFLGVSASAIQPGRATGGGTGCEYPAASGTPSDRARTVLVSVSTGDTHDRFQESVKNARVAEKFTPLTGIGDEGFAAVSGGGWVHDAEARRGQLRVRVVVSGQNAAAADAASLLRTAVSRV